MSYCMNTIVPLLLFRHKWCYYHVQWLISSSRSHLSLNPKTMNKRQIHHQWYFHTVGPSFSQKMAPIHRVQHREERLQLWIYMDGEGEIKPPREINTQIKSGIACITHYIVVLHFFIHVNRVKKKGRTVFAID